ncbi:hypothetical protein ACCC98_06730 [Rhizobium pisi]|uniref:hypothetical protein n=1 Tax=Rhizobium pisi TaxID=574561 RepID=UPI0039AEB69D
MTLIAIALSPNFVIQMSDRRVLIKYSAPKPATVVDDDRCKTIVYTSNGGDWIISYAGIANLNANSAGDAGDLAVSGTDLWLAEYLARCSNISEAMNGLSDALKRRCSSKLRLFRGSPLIVMASGFSLDRARKWLPVAVHVSNFGDDRELFTADGTEFRQSVRVGRADLEHRFLGAHVPPKVRNRVIRTIRHLSKHKWGTDSLIRVFETAFRSTNKTEESVGDSYLVSILPLGAVRKSIAENERLWLLGPPTATTGAFFLINPEGSDNSITSQRSPIFVGSGYSITNFSVFPLES